MYKILLSMHERHFFHCKWLLSIKDCLTLSGNQNTWQLQGNVPIGIAKLVKMKLNENYKQEWSESDFNSPKCLNYRIFKAELVFEQYFNLLPQDLATALCHFRSLNHKLPVEYIRGVIIKFKFFLHVFFIYEYISGASSCRTFAKFCELTFEKCKQLICESPANEK